MTAVGMEMTRRRFEELVADALDTIPAELTRAMDNVVVLVEDRNPEEPELLGLYEPRNDGRAPVVSVWMRTAKREQIVAFKTFLRTLIHEWMHHLEEVSHHWPLAAVMTVLVPMLVTGIMGFIALGINHRTAGVEVRATREAIQAARDEAP